MFNWRTCAVSALPGKMGASLGDDSMSRQAPDRLILDGRERLLISEPLEPYLRDLHTRPDFRIDDGVNQRGYVATWEVKSDDTLWLTGLQTCSANERDPGLNLLFPGAAVVPATWVSQKLHSADGERRYDHRGYTSNYA